MIDKSSSHQERTEGFLNSIQTLLAQGVKNGKKPERIQNLPSNISPQKFEDQ